MRYPSTRRVGDRHTADGRRRRRSRLWKLNHYYERLDDWNAEQGITPAPNAPPAAESLWELHNLTTDPEERRNLAEDEPESRGRLSALLAEQRDEKRRLPQHRNPLPATP